MKRLFILFAAIATATPAVAGDVRYVMHIDGITCPFCVATSESALRHVQGVKSVSSSLKDGTITVCADDLKARFSDGGLRKMFRDRGFTYRGMQVAGACQG